MERGRLRDNAMKLSIFLDFFKCFSQMPEKINQCCFEKIKGSDFNFDYIDKLYYGCYSLKIGGPYIDSQFWLKSKNAANNPKNED